MVQQQQQGKKTTEAEEFEWIESINLLSFDYTRHSFWTKIHCFLRKCILQPSRKTFVAFCIATAPIQESIILNTEN